MSVCVHLNIVVLEETSSSSAQNGFGFDYPILKHHLEKLKVSFTNDLMCADCYHAFYDILESRKRMKMQKGTLNKDEIDEIGSSLQQENSLHMQQVNESTPKRQIIKTASHRVQNSMSKAVRRFPWSQGEKPKEKYKLKDVYERLLNRPCIDAHRAENDCVMALQCSVVLSQDFVHWVDGNHKPFAEVKPMTIGLLLVTGILWGCTNPFIRRGTRGLRAVRGRSWLSQLYAEGVFLLGNWKYVVPWLVNQGGSLAYLAALQRLPLCVAVPGANSLAFVCTAATGAACQLLASFW
ncbi:unnamed protein product [Leptidea sinapis]|uniref:Uncharacterized protein n=1 Tax=Leptidea sinapis TaxID=189913 RepID=A0A5E4PWW3_9NEOP|nr:unnamed protein product [Leptidea sinapis]